MRFSRSDHHKCREVPLLEWSQTHYNLIVYGNTDTPIFRQGSGLDSFPVERLLESTDDDVRAEYQDDLASLSEMLALVVAELQPWKGVQPAFVSRIDQIEKRRRDVHFRFEHLFDRLTSDEVFKCGYFDINVSGRWGGESQHTHWALKKGNLMEGVLGLLGDQPKDRVPKAFGVEQWPLPPLGHVAVMMPFTQVFDAVYDAVKAACSVLRLDTMRVNEIYGPTSIMVDIFKTIEQSSLVVSDLTGRNPNVLYETGPRTCTQPRRNYDRSEPRRRSVRSEAYQTCPVSTEWRGARKARE